MPTESTVAPLAVNERVAAKMLSVSVAALRRWRREKKGPKFARLSRCVRYSIQDLENFLNENVQITSADEGHPSQEFVPVGTRVRGS
jgi:Helix-turn-helix domain